MKALIALVPSAGVLFLFYIAIKAMLEGDRRERAAYQRWEKEQEKAARNSPQGPTSSPS